MSWCYVKKGSELSISVNDLTNHGFIGLTIFSSRASFHGLELFKRIVFISFVKPVSDAFRLGQLCSRQPS
jgi:hypothetical protein